MTIGMKGVSSYLQYVVRDDCAKAFIEKGLSMIMSTLRRAFKVSHLEKRYEIIKNTQ
jgi:hypothetical protein